jgi:hypothetical protein
MPQREKLPLRFVRALLAGGRARRRGETFTTAGDGTGIGLPAPQVRDLVSDGVLGADAEACWALPGTAQWLKRQLLDADAFAAQHRVEVQTAAGVTVNIADSPLQRLAIAGADGEAFLKPHHLEAGVRVGRLVDRARLQPRLTMNYSAAHIAKGSRRGEDIGDMAADARKMLADLMRRLPRECADVVIDVCGLGKGLQQIETERGWPRRSAKLVLRIGLECAAEHFGLGEAATGRETGRQRAWMEGERVAMFVSRSA